jgi:hypothetical protein
MNGVDMARVELGASPSVRFWNYAVLDPPRLEQAMKRYGPPSSGAFDWALKSSAPVETLVALMEAGVRPSDQVGWQITEPSMQSALRECQRRRIHKHLTVLPNSIRHMVGQYAWHYEEGIREVREMLEYTGQ